MSNGIKNKLQELIGKNVHSYYGEGYVYITFPGNDETILKIENDDCVVLKNIQYQSLSYVAIDKITFIRTT